MTAVLPILATALRLVTYNVNYANPDQQASLDAIATTDADIVLLQEITPSWQRALARRFQTQYPHQVFHIHARAAGGIAVLSKLDIESDDLLPSPNPGWFPAERIVVRTESGRVQILNVHLRPAIDNGSWIKGYFTTPPLRLREIQTYWPRLVRDLPTIVAGDFNESPEGSALAFLAKRGFTRVATPAPRTWRYEVTRAGKRSEVLAMDIDHVMIDRHFTAREPRVLDAGTSDHRPVAVTITAR